ncbi:MAG: GNAT family N-acetyltransferase, partial [Bacteroidales bacterium]|nr:GNAT family N-acetyltransferase [Bacteroidales bacterium]
MMKSVFKNYSEYQIRRLKSDERINSFNCGDDDLNDFILNESHHYQKALLSVTYVYEHIDSGEIIGYFTLANDRVSLTDFESKTEFNRFRKSRFVNEKRIKSY